MSKKMKSILTLLIPSLIATWLIPGPLAVAVAEEWTQFRGPNGSGVSVTTGLPEQFGPEKNVIWKTPLPPGHSSPVLTHDRIFVTAYEKANSEQQTANRLHRLKTGKKGRAYQVHRIGKLNEFGPTKPYEFCNL